MVFVSIVLELHSAKNKRDPCLTGTMLDHLAEGRVGADMMRRDQAARVFTDVHKLRPVEKNGVGVSCLVVQNLFISTSTRPRRKVVDSRRDSNSNRQRETLIQDFFVQRVSSTARRKSQTTVTHENSYAIKLPV